MGHRAKGTGQKLDNRQATAISSRRMARSQAGKICFSLLLAFAGFQPSIIEANPYLAKPGENPVTVRAATCAISGGFIHLYSALDYGLFDRYGIRVEFVSIRGSGVALGALATDEIQLLYCAADATIPGMAAGSDAKLIGAPLAGLPWVMLARKDIKRPEDLRGKRHSGHPARRLDFSLGQSPSKKIQFDGG